MVCYLTLCISGIQNFQILESYYEKGLYMLTLHPQEGVGLTVSINQY